tara:strand:+ start:729 stop:956 length:228 start_codon:yes stop_codon:yes gene_type:complete
MQPKHVQDFFDSITYPEYTDEQKKKGLNNKDLDFMTEGNAGMYYAVFIPSVLVIGAGLLPWIAMLIHRHPMFQIM